jgi:hypothetical protein
MLRRSPSRIAAALQMPVIALVTDSHLADRAPVCVANGDSFETTLVLRGTVTSVAAVPEPQAYPLMATGLLIVAWLTRRRRGHRLQLA